MIHYQVLKHQFILPKNIANRQELDIVLETDFYTYGHIRPQMTLKGRTPHQAYNGVELDYAQISQNRLKQRKIRLEKNQKGGCGVC